VVTVENDAYLVPLVEHDREVFLKTIIPSRKATRDNPWRQPTTRLERNGK